MLGVVVAPLIFLTTGILFNDGRICLFVKRELTFQFFFQVPNNYSEEDRYLASIQSLPPDDPQRLAVANYRRYVIDSDPCTENLPRLCLW